MPVDMKY